MLSYLKGSHSVGRLADAFMVMGGHGVRRAQQLLGAYRGGDELRPRNGPQLFWKQKINTKSLTEAELVGVDDSLGYILWACYFVQE